MWLFLILVGVPIIEIALFIQVGGFIGLWPTLAIVVLTAAAGTVLMRQQGVSTLEKLKTTVESGGNPSSQIAHGALILVAGLLLLTPGFFTDTIGLLLLVPPVREKLVAKMSERAQTHIFTAAASNTTHSPRHDDTIDGDFEVMDDENTKPGDSDWTRRP